MGQIKRLSKNVSDKIAAGEVVERPLSAVKEMVENAVDAGASSISISIDGGGIKQICVTDNGTGIAADDAALVFENHATSKIFSEKDLFYISSQGFRGEALASISAVAIVEMKTKQRDDEMGTIIRVSGGQMDGVSPAGLPDGTSVTASNLFYNVPVRLKFLKSESQEAAYVSDLISRYILAFPEISFHYTSQGKTIYHSSGNGDLRSAIYCVYGADLMENLIHVEYEANDIKVAGYVSRPGAVIKNKQKGSIFVNRRFVRNSSLQDMVRNAYGPSVVKGEFPFFALNITMPAGAVDVNVHPNKLQVRFKDSASIEYAIKEAVSEACRHTHGSVKMNVPEKSATAVPIPRMVEMHASAEVMQTELFSGFARTTLRESQQTSANDAINSIDLSAQIQKDGDNKKDLEYTADPEYDDEPVLFSAGERLIGSFADTYVLVEQGNNLLIIDQHAAHERLLYDKFVSARFVASQPLLIPQVLTVSHPQKNIIEENIEIFQSLGFDLEPFGTMEYKVSAIPMLFYKAGVTELINEALNEIAQGSKDVVLKRERIIRAACRSAVKAGDKLSEYELNSLVNSFLRTDVIPTCPHGRPVISVLTKSQIEKSFKRVL